MGNAFAFAARLLSVLPPLSLQAPTRDEARRSVAFFPLVGALLGLLTACAWNLASRLWSNAPLVAASVALAAGAILTGGRLLAGTARAGDGLAAYAASGSRPRAFAVMHDLRCGPAGMVALVVAVLLKVSFLMELPAALSWRGLLLMGALGSWSSAFGLAAFPMASASGEDPDVSHGLADAGSTEFLAATVISIAAAALIPVRGMLILIAVACVVGAAAAGIHQRLGGLSLPLVQALGALGEMATLACLAVRLQ